MIRVASFILVSSQCSHIPSTMSSAQRIAHVLDQFPSLTQLVQKNNGETEIIELLYGCR